MKSYSAFLLRVGLWLLTALALLWTPLLNGYPFIHADTGTYLWSSVNFGVPLDRPVGYSLFLRAVSLAPTLWMAPLAHALGTAYLSLRVAEIFLARTRARVWIAFAIVLATIVVSTVSLVVGYILADIFAAWLWLATILFVLSPFRFERALAALALIASVWAHNSHVAIAVGLALGFGALAIALRRAEFVKRVAGYAGVIVFAIVSMGLLNVFLFATPMPTRGGDTILLSRFHEFGALRETLEQNCARERWAMCEYLELVRAHDREYRWFLHGADSPVLQVGFDKFADQQRAIVLRALACCGGKILVESAAESWRQFWLMQMFDYPIPNPEDKVSLTALRALYPHEWETYLASAQQRDAAPLTWLLPAREEVMLGVWLFVGAVVFVSAWRVRARALMLWLLGTLAFVAWNAVVMAVFSGAVTRYQARVAWLIPFAVLVAVGALYPRFKRAAIFQRD